MKFDYYMNPFAEWIGWYPKEYSREERVLVNKLDFLILTFACLSTFACNLDVNAIYNAYESGLETDLGLTGNRLSYINAVYWAATTAFQVPSQLLLMKIPAHYYIPICEIMWGCFTLGTAFAQNYNQLIIMRFFVGLTSTPCWIGNVHVINTWYRKRELGKRNAVYYNTYPLGSMFSGYLQTACINLDGTGGLAGWRWLFIMCTVITIPISFCGFIFYPNIPSDIHSRFLTPAEKELARVRLTNEGFAEAKPLTFATFKRACLAWQTWVFTILANLFWQTPYPSTTPYLLWLGVEYPNDDAFVNNMSTVSYAISIISAMFFAFYSDWRQKRWDSMVFAGFVVLVGNIILLKWDVSNAAKYYAFISIGFCNGPINLIIAWWAETLAYDLEARSISIGVINGGYCILALVLPLCAWQTKDAPRYFAGYIFAVTISVLELLMIPLPLYLERRDRRLGKYGVEAIESVTDVGLEEIAAEIGENGSIDYDLEKKGGEDVFVNVKSV
ncbi:major facilitator superfamily domain-containing protein [Limtongia smithiae]|uniref:major facilitator superfamily domain-containing protein n=1 Tax=Limtongia smithiae TaxID=1125753 RepID=UPI0034CDAA83